MSQPLRFTARLAWITQRLLGILSRVLSPLLSRGGRGRRIAAGISVTALAVAAGCSANKSAPAETHPPMGTQADAGHRGSVGPTYGERSYDSDRSDDYDDAPAEYAEASPSPASPESAALGTQADVRMGRQAKRRSRHARRSTSPAPARVPTHTPGLGTAYGEQHNSTVVNTRFERDNSSPDAVLSLWYNDWEGVRSMAAAYGSRGTSTAIATGTHGPLTVALVDGRGQTLPASDIDGRRYAAGIAGSSYKIRVSNNSAFRFEVVASVDGLDVIDGSDAAYHKRGYVLDAWSSITIDGWRTSDDTVAAFRFSGIEDSYAKRTGKGRNVGVVGVAFFHERGTNPWREHDRRHSSDPFPGQYAPPPPPRWR